MRPTYFTSPQVNDLQFINENEGCAVGGYGCVAHTVDGGRRSSNGVLQAQPWGAYGNTPQPGDFDGDGKFDLSVWRSSNSTCYIHRSTNGVTMEQVFGVSSNVAVSSANVP